MISVFFFVFAFFVSMFLSDVGFCQTLFLVLCLVMFHFFGLYKVVFYFVLCFFRFYLLRVYVSARVKNVVNSLVTRSRPIGRNDTLTEGCCFPSTIEDAEWNVPLVYRW